MMTVLMMLITVSAMSAEQKIWLHISGNGKAQVSLDGKTLELDKDNMATVKDAAGLKVAVSVKPDDGYTVTSVTAQLTTDAGNADTRGADDASFLEVTKASDTEYTFTMPEDFNVRIYVTIASSSKGGGDRSISGDDYSGTYYIASDAIVSSSHIYNPDDHTNNYYLCPTENWISFGTSGDTEDTWTTGDDKPFLTTYQINAHDDYDNTKAKWTIEYYTTIDEKDYYYIKHSSGKYLVLNKQINGVSGSNSQYRIRVHLESLIPTDLENETTRNNALFTISLDKNGYYYIHPKPQSSYWLTVNKGNGDYLQGENRNKGGTITSGSTTYGMSGTIGIYYTTSTDDTKYLYLEDVIARPTIKYNGNNEIEITALQLGATLIYTTNGSTPTTSNGTVVNNSAVTFDPADGVTTIKAVAVVNGELSKVTTYTPIVLLGSTHKYIIQSKQYQFYNLIPNLSVDENTKNVSTLNVPCETMAWHFEYAEEGYYYIVDNNGWYLYYTTTDNTYQYVYLKSSKDDSDGFKFSITAHANGGFNLIPKGQTTPVNGTTVGLTPAKIAGGIGDATSRWDIIPYNVANLPQWADAPFTNVSDDNHTYYYQIVSVSQPTMPIILNNDGDIKSQTIPDGIDERKTIWVIKKVADDDNDLLDFYTFENAYTGQKLYYNGKGRNKSTNVLQLDQPSVTGANEQWSHFVIAQTVSGYNIIPRLIVDNTKAINTSSNEAFNCINRRGGNDILGTYYDDGNGSRWTFSQVDFCMPPVFEESGENIIITCPTKGDNIEIHYTTDGTVPTSSSTPYNNDLSSSTQQIITAIAILKSGETVKATSTHSTLFNKPDIILKEGEDVVGENTYTYDGSEKTPTPSKVSIGETEITSGYAVTYENNKNAGTATLILTDDNTTDNWYIMNASKTFTIGQLEAELAWSNTTLAYDENPKVPTVTVSNLVEGDVCTVTLTIDGENATVTEGVKTAVKVGSYTATATALSNANYKLPTDEADRKCDFTIASSIVFSISINGWTYGGSPNDPVATGNDDRIVTYAYKVKDAADVTYSETVPTKAGNYTVKGTIVAEGDYAESVATADFTIAAKSLSTGTAPNFTPADGITIDIDRDDEGYTITLKDGETALVAGTEGTEYDYSKSIDDTDSNFGKVTVTGANNYTGSFTSTYAKVAFTKPEEAGGGFAEAGLFDIPESSSIGDTATPAGLEAYIVVGINDDRTVKIEKLDYIPEGVPVLLLSNNEVSNGFTIMPRNGVGTDITNDQKTKNKLKKASGTEEQRHVDFATIYLLYRGEFVLNIAGTLPEGKIYLDAGGPSSGTRSSRLPIARGYSTGIKGVEDNEKTEIQDGRWYSLDGRRFTEKPTKKGIYLREGKKVVIK